LAFYAPYQKLMPSPQVRLLSLWDDLGIPHEERKQISGLSIPIIGIQVDPNLMLYSLPMESLQKLKKELEEWVSWKGKRNVRSWQQLAGWVNWCLNVFPLLRPALSNVYSKLRTQPNQNGLLCVNNAVRKDLLWALETASHVIYCDACPAGLGFWYPDLDLAYFALAPPDDVTQLIFYLEALCVVCTIRDACEKASALGRFVIYTDNQNMVNVFSSLSAQPAYNILLTKAVDLLTLAEHDLRVFHVPGE
jgi:hypothetical protein